MFLGAVNWVHKLNWHGAGEFALAKRHPIRGRGNGYYKEARRLSFWWVFGSGHWVRCTHFLTAPNILSKLLQTVRDFYKGHTLS